LAPMSKPARYWSAAAVLALSVVLRHGLVGQWAPALSPEWQKPITELLPLSPWVTLILLGSLARSVAGAVGGVMLMFVGLSTRDQQRWAAESKRRQRLWAMEDQIREECLPAEERERRRRYREEQAEIQREARRRLGLPEVDAP
jgi:hypothetical protein